MRNWCTYITLYFFKNIHERRWISYSLLHGKGETMSLSWSMIGVLTEDDDSHFFKRCHIHRSKYIFWMGVDSLTTYYLVFYKLRELSEIRLLKFSLKRMFPALMDFYFCHGASRECRYSSMNPWITLEVSIGLGICVILKSEILLAESLAVRTIILP